ncbi:hypothetical protein G4G27_05775 [Sphingomonas sp. So64.6b]|uniref:hypothetical protein n=1 Tax=Sphingomonas sp. So64.6b TaxID=2997354 RepID=UPI0016017FB4|nr:hypothetical protein [Sphingomonas sp. So64.6b]QNA83566.1 hypothetical protein G4G27_05775 [Sphingomonas sp. So64.6b]
MNIIRFALVFIVGVSLAGCGTIGSKARINPSSMAVYKSADGTCPYVRGLGDVSRVEAIDLSCFAFQGSSDKAYTLASRSNVDRNRLEAALLKHADDICVLEKGRMVANQAMTNTSLSFATTALSTVSTIVGGEQAKSILSGAAAITSGTQDHVNANFYKNQIIQAITKAIDGERSAALTALISKRQTDFIIYTVDEMIRMVNVYHQTCSFEHGMQVLLDATINREGLNAIVQERNLRSTATDLIAAINAANNRGNPGKATATRLEEALREVQLRRAALSQTVQGTNLTSD